jgi:hypothetical protein
MKKNLEKKYFDVMNNKKEIRHILNDMRNSLGELFSFRKDPKFFYDPEKILLYSVAEFSIICCGMRGCLDFHVLDLALSRLFCWDGDYDSIVESVIENDTNFYDEVAKHLQSEVQRLHFDSEILDSLKLRLSRSLNGSVGGRYDDFVNSIIKYDTDYKKITELLQLDSEISKCGTVFKNHIKGSKEDIEDLLIFLHCYRERYLPVIYKIMMSCIYEITVSVFDHRRSVFDHRREEELFPKAKYFENTIKAIQRTVKSLIDKLEAYLEVRAIL